MKNILLIFLFMLIELMSYGQMDFLYKLQLKMGGNTAFPYQSEVGFWPSHHGIIRTFKPSLGFTIDINYNININNRIAFAPEIGLQQIRYCIREQKFGTESSNPKGYGELSFSYLSFSSPIQYKLLNKYNLYIGIGPYFSVLANAKSKVKLSYWFGSKEIKYTERTTKDYKDIYKYYDFGIIQNLELFLTPKNHLRLSIFTKMNIGFNNLHHLEYHMLPEQFRNLILTIGLGLKM